MLSEKNYIKNHLAQTTPYPLELEIESAKGILLFDKEGNAYFDMISGIGVSNIGHGNPKVIDAIKIQAEKHLHVMVYGEFIQKKQSGFAKELLSFLPKSLNSLYPLNSGTEANEVALKLAKRATDRSKIVAFKGSYHGNTHGSMSISYNELRKAPFRPLLPDVHFIELNKPDQLNSIDDKTACVFLETIQGDAGVRIPKKEFLIELRDKCNQTETLLIFDEVQCGIGRTGKMFAFEHFDVIPDILTLGKSLGAGMPIGAMVANQKLMSLLSDNPTLGHITTFGGHPVVMAAAEAGLKVIKEEQLLDKVEAKGVLLEKLLQHASIVEIRRIGLMFALEFESPEIVQKVVENCLSKRVLTFWFLSNPNSIRLAPPLIITETQIEETAKLIVEAINESI